VRAEFLNALNCVSVHASMTGQQLSIDSRLPKFDLTQEMREKQEQERMVEQLAALCVSEE
jgi:hypothetical protein